MFALVPEFLPPDLVTPAMLATCFVCGTQAAVVKKCSRCKSIGYCSVGAFGSFKN